MATFVIRPPDTVSETVTSPRRLVPLPCRFSFDPGMRRFVSPMEIANSSRSYDPLNGGSRSVSTGDAGAYRGPSARVWRSGPDESAWPLIAAPAAGGPWLSSTCVPVV